MKKPAFSKKLVFEILLVTGLLLVAGLSHGINMLHFPYFENDEGAYLSQAWSLVEFGKLAPYTYWYDHAPAGWILLAIWVKLTGGTFAFGDMLVSGRVFMLIMHISNTLMLYLVTRKLTKSMYAASIAALLFSLSPLAIYYHRRVLLDNIMVFWSLLSILVLLREKIKLRHVFLSAICFALAALTKENAIFFFPGIYYAIYIYSHKVFKLFAMISWLAVTGIVASTYFLYALLKGELMPPGEGEERVSLVGTLQYQAGRGADAPFWSSMSDFHGSFLTWLGKDPYIVIFGVVASVLILATVFRQRAFLIPILLIAMSWLYLLRGGLVIDFYIAALVPFLAMAVGVVADQAVQLIPDSHKFLKRIAPVALFVVLLAPSTTYSFRHYTVDETDPQLNAINWMRENLSAKDNIIIDQAIYMEMRNPSKGPVFENADWFWKAQLDPEIRIDKYDDDWREVNYIALSHEMVKSMKGGGFDFLEDVYVNTEYVIGWNAEGSETYINMDERISTNGDWMYILRVRDEYDAVLENSWAYYKDNFIVSYGQVIDPFTNDRTTSEGQSYALLRAVYMDDRETFDRVYSWTVDHLGHRTNDVLFSWAYEKGEDGEYHKLDHETASDADEDIALALLFAYKRWEDPEYLETARVLLADIWEHEVVTIAGKNYFAPNTNPRRGDYYLLNPSYFSPASYRIFAEADPTHDWESLVDSSYDLLELLAGEYALLPPNWLMLSNDGTIASAVPYAGDSADQYGFDAFRTMWRVAVDAEWFDEPRAEAYLKQYEMFFINSWRYNLLASVYDDEERIGGGTLSTDVGPLSVLFVGDLDMQTSFYEDRFKPQYDMAGFWGEKTNYYGQNWVWFGTALYSKNFPNLWDR